MLAVGVALALGVAACAYGVLRAEWSNAWWDADALLRFVATLAVLTVAIVVLSRVGRVDAPASAALATALVFAAAGRAGALLVVLLFVLACLLVGRRLREVWGDTRDDALIDGAVGAGTYGTLASVLAHFPVSYDATWLGLLALPILADHRRARERCLRIAAAARASRGGAVGWIAAVLAALYGVVALFPEVGYDALAMHLFIPAHVDAHARWTFDPVAYAWSLMPTLVDFVYAAVYVPGGEAAARLVNAVAAVLCAAMTARLAATAGASRGWSELVAALLLATPLVYAIGTSLFVDAGWTALVLGAVVTLVAVRSGADAKASWVTGAVLLGFAAASKAVTLPLLPAFGLVVLAQALRLRPPHALRSLVIVGAVLVLASAKPYATSWLITGNPVYPFYMHVFGGPTFEWWTTGPSHFAQPTTWRTLYDITFHTERYVEGHVGTAGFQWLALLPATFVTLALARRWTALGLAAMGLSVIAIVFGFTTYLRYVVPGLVLLLAAIAVAGTTLAAMSTRVAMLFAASAAVAVLGNLLVLNAAVQLAGFPIEALDRMHWASLRAQRLPILQAAEVAARIAEPGQRIAYFASPAFAAAPTHTALHSSWYNPPFARALREATSPEALAAVLLEWNSPIVVVALGWSDYKDWIQRVTAATRPIVELPGASVRAVRPELMYAHELLANSDFASLAGWTLIGEARHDAHGLVLTVAANSPAYQVVAVRPGASFLNAVRARCPQDTRYRLQVNWLDGRSQFIATSAKEIPCTGTWDEQTQKVIAPPGATLAVVYASGATAQPVEIGYVSLRGVRR